MYLADRYHEQGPLRRFFVRIQRRSRKQMKFCFAFFGKRDILTQVARGLYSKFKK